MASWLSSLTVSATGMRPAGSPSTATNIGARGEPVLGDAGLPQEPAVAAEGLPTLHGGPDPAAGDGLEGLDVGELQSALAGGATTISLLSPKGQWRST